MGSLLIKIRGILSLLRAAVAGTGYDYTSGDLSKAIVMLAVPMVLEMSMESLFGFVDAIFVTRLGKEAVATVLLTESVLVLEFGIAIGLSISTQAMVARRVGEGDLDGAGRTAVQAILLGAAVSVLTGGLGFWFAEDILRIMGATEAMIADGTLYASILLGCSITIFEIFLLNAIFRGAGDASIALRTLMLSNGINIVLDPCLIFGLGPFPEMGLAGAATATAIGRGTGVLFQLAMVTIGLGRIRVQRRQWAFDAGTMWRLLRVSATGILQVQIATARWTGLVRIMATFGSAALGGYGLAARTIMVVILPAWGLANAGATLVGQNLGAGKPDRAEAAVYRAGWFNMGFLGLISLLFIFAPGAVLAIYQPEPAMVPFGTACLRFVGYGYVIYAWSMVLVQAFNGSGDTRTPTWINLFAYWVWQIPLAYVLSTPMGLGPTGVFLSIPVTECMVMLVAWRLFRRGSWKTVRV